MFQGVFFPYRPKKRNVPNDKRAKTDYQSDAKLSGVAKRLYRQYKKLFDEFAERNFQNNATESQNLKKPVTNTETDSMHVTGDNDEKAPATTNTDVDTDTRFALLTDEDLAEYR